MQDFRALVRRQLELEDDARALGARRYASRQLPWRTEAGTAEEEANLPPGRQLIKLCLPPVIEAINGFIDEACSGKAGRRHDAVDVLLLSDPEEIAYLAIRTIVNLSAVRSTLQNAAVAVADAVIENVEFKAFAEQNRAGYKGYMKQQEARGYSRQRRAAVRKLFEAENVRVAFPLSTRANVGIKLIELVNDATGLFTTEPVKHKRGYIYKLRPTETVQDWIEKQHERCSLMAPVNLPMLVRPRRWRSPTYGGYLTPRPGNRLVKQRNKAYHVELRNIEMPDVYESVNHIQDSPWRINAAVLDVMSKVWEGGTSLGGLPQREDDPVPAKPFDIDTNEEAKTAWKREAAGVYSRNAERLSARLAVSQGLWTARRFKDEERIYFPHELDFRGRVYPIPVSGPSPQGCDWQKALLEFADGKPLGEEGRFWLLVHIANLFGVDKVPFEDRIRWTLANAPKLLDSAKDPLDGDRFWTTADSPYCALAACFEFAGWLRDGDNHVSRLAVALDGSCSGLQHFSAMLRDANGGAAVNLLPSETPQDVYRRVADAAQAFADANPVITYEATENGEKVERTMVNPWMNGKVSRGIAKRPTMTFCYSATRFGMHGMILQTLRELDREAEAKGEGPYLGGADNYHAAMWLSHVIYSSVRSTVSAAARAMDWLRDAASVAAKDGLPLLWTTPMGLPILQEYRTKQGRRLDIHWAGSRVRLTLDHEGDKIDSRAQANGVAPNFVHSLDAAHLQAVALRAKREGIQHLAVIHDSFGTHACDTGRLSRILRETFVEQYSGDVLGDFYEQLKQQLGEELAAELPAPPKPGDMDLSLILDAEYTFA